jgi:hypothetical protein
VPILSSKRRDDRRWRNFRWRADRAGREIVPQEKQHKSDKQPAEASDDGLATQVLTIAFCVQDKQGRAVLNTKKAGSGEGERLSDQEDFAGGTTLWI